MLIFKKILLGVGKKKKDAKKSGIKNLKTKDRYS